ncbi:hypothetical protein Naga_101007g2 [Nannochloropsis gaditana]|uniref:Uncharacterized protein n=1 Tax=Nannochloropsis gaditana TaxID=72520 RepID=W7TQS7_9STRA|nr:hypothetical protein Naga_101007g2 [Nannochloropsis gaditana]
MSGGPKEKQHVKTQAGADDGKRRRKEHKAKQPLSLQQSNGGRGGGRGGGSDVGRGPKAGMPAGKAFAVQGVEERKRGCGKTNGHGGRGLAKPRQEAGGTSQPQRLAQALPQPHLSLPDSRAKEGKGDRRRGKAHGRCEIFLTPAREDRAIEIQSPRTGES